MPGGAETVAALCLTGIGGMSDPASGFTSLRTGAASASRLSTVSRDNDSTVSLSDDSAESAGAGCAHRVIRSHSRPCGHGLKRMMSSRTTLRDGSWRNCAWVRLSSRGFYRRRSA